MSNRSPVDDLENHEDCDRLNAAFARFRGVVRDEGFKVNSPEIRRWLEGRLGFPPPIQIKDLPVEQIEEFAGLLEAKHFKNLIEKHSNIQPEAPSSPVKAR